MGQLPNSAYSVFASLGDDLILRNQAVAVYLIMSYIYSSVRSRVSVENLVMTVIVATCHVRLLLLP